MQKSSRVGLVAVGLVVAFAGGWLVAQAQNADKVSIDKVWVDRWVADVSLLARNGQSRELANSDQVSLMIGSGLNILSPVLGQRYDHLSPALRSQLAFYIPAARAIASAQQGSGPWQGRKDLLTFANCMQTVQATGGTMSGCVGTREK